MDGELHFSSIAALATAYRNRSTSPVEVVRWLLDRIARLDPTLNSFITALESEGLAEAEGAARELKAGHDRGPLHGVPVAIKDLIDLAGVSTTFASRAGSPRMAATDAVLVRNLKQAGAIILGKTNLLEYAYGAVHPEFGQTNNPWDPRRTSGGSSGGSAAAVAAGLCFAAVGTDTGGSIRIPASYCGVAGLKPSFGRVSLEGVQALSPTLDHAGPLARSCADAALMLSGMTGTSLHIPCAELRGLRIGIMHHPGADKFMQAEVQAHFDQVIRGLDRAGAHVRRMQVPDLELARDALIAIIEPEASLIHRDLLRREPGGFSGITRAQLEAGFKISAVDYLGALRVRERLTAEFRRALESVDAILSPSVPWVAPAEDPPVGGEEGIGEMMYSGIYNLVGLPALSVPCGMSSEGLPSGLQIVTGWHKDELALSIGLALEVALPFDERALQMQRPS
ncbi:MAG TPA: amidase [Dongiaceae bacterium]|nr:amidase [Dongiaceae bacterium]